MVRMRARSFSRVNGMGGLSELRDMEGEVLLVFTPMPTTERYSEEE